MRFKTLLLILFITSWLCMPVLATDSEQSALTLLDAIKTILQESNNKFLSSLTTKFDSFIADINEAVSDSDKNCSSKIDRIISKANNLSSKIKRKKCKTPRKKSQCAPIDTVDEILSKINDFTDFLSSSNDGDIVDICKKTDSTNCLINDEPEQTTGTTTTSNDEILGCEQNETLDLSTILNSDKLTFSTMAVVDTKLDLGNIEFYKYPLSMGDIYIAKNTSYIPVEVMVSLDESTNVSPDIPSIISLPPKSQEYAFKVCIADGSMPWNYNYSFKDEQGFSTSVHTGDGNYFLPFNAGETYTVTQGEMGTFSHFGEFLYSIDFGMPEDTEVTAMRNGTVVFIKEDSNEGGPDKALIDKANFVWILHNDNSIGRYVHLKQNGPLVNAGDNIKAGDLIGYSGNTGYTQGPHLHAQVVLPKGFSEEEKIPIRFKGIDGALEEEQSYTALPICK